MLQPATLNFLKNLSDHNDKTWFDANRDAYMAAKDDFESLVVEVLHGLAAAEPLFKEIKAKECIFRIYKDVRFAKDKTPYKTCLSAAFSRGGKKFPGAGYYLHIEPGKSFIGGGVWMPEPSLLKAVRQEIDYNLASFTKIIDAPAFKKAFGHVEGEALKKVPAGYEADNPAAEYLRLKSFTVGHSISDADVTGKDLAAICKDIFSAMQPFINFLNQSLD